MTADLREAWLPDWVFGYTAAPRRAGNVLVFLWTHAHSKDREPVVWPSRWRLQETLGLDPSNLCKALQWLEQQGLISPTVYEGHDAYVLRWRPPVKHDSTPKRQHRRTRDYGPSDHNHGPSDHNHGPSDHKPWSTGPP